MPSPLPPESSRLSPRRWLRAGLTLALVLVLHLIAGLWFAGYRAPANPDARDDTPVQVELLEPQPIERAPAPAAPAPKPAPKPVPRPAAKPAPAAPRNQAPVLTSTAPSAPATAPPGAGQAAGAGTGQGAASASATASAAVPASAAASGVKFIAPPSGDLRYGAYFNGNLNGTATIHWTTEGDRYRLLIEIPVPFVGPFVYESLGRIDAYGIAPDRYTEQRGRKPADIAIFNRQTKQVVFTRTPNSLPLTDGMQDRFSLLMQLSGLVHGAPDVYRPGVAREFRIIDNNSGETWPIVTIGDETIRTATSSLETRHFRRLPRREGDTRRIDIWLAPSLDWLPVRLVQTEPNGSEIELLWQGRGAPSRGIGYDESAAMDAPASIAPAAPASAPASTSAPAAGASSAGAASAPVSSDGMPAASAAEAASPVASAPQAASQAR
ncbi:DUF3108 domain-containing protein [Burkholderia gladioli]|uniref:DUF3108 domain-containing protein n=1 Tax=Burkholderia gladioli TaxID=28095 RepID=UPI00163EA16F|nr:DUF3108 domain-containing protein [Burkholderia gladioli]